MKIPSFEEVETFCYRLGYLVGAALIIVPLIALIVWAAIAATQGIADFMISQGWR